MASHSLDQVMIQAMARWHSPMLSHYAGLAPLRAITQEFKRRRSDRPLEPYRAGGSVGQVKASKALCDRLDSMCAQLQDIKTNEEKLEARVHALQTAATPKAYVINEVSGRWHRCRDDNLEGSPSHWSSMCGWKYAGSHFARARITPEGLHSSKLCEKCLPYDKAEARLKEAAQAPSGGSSGSECS